MMVEIDPQTAKRQASEKASTEALQAILDLQRACEEAAEKFCRAFPHGGKSCIRSWWHSMADQCRIHHDALVIHLSYWPYEPPDRSWCAAVPEHPSATAFP